MAKERRCGKCGMSYDRSFDSCPHCRGYYSTLGSASHSRDTATGGQLFLNFLWVGFLVTVAVLIEVVLLGIGFLVQCPGPFIVVGILFGWFAWIVIKVNWEVV